MENETIGTSPLRSLALPRETEPMQDKQMLFAALRAQVQRLSPLPANTLLFGVSQEDRKPVLFDMAEPDGGAILVRGEKGSGKTTLLQTIAWNAAEMYRSQQLQFVVATPAYLEWLDFQELPACGGVFSTESNRFERLVDALGGWMYRFDKRQTLLLLIDGIGSLNRMGSRTRMLLDRVLAYGPYSNIWTVATADPDDLDHDAAWPDLFAWYIHSASKHCSPTFDHEFSVRTNDGFCRFSILF
ncbi:MAG TPA: FtsK/SpoIIIE domain-containing protein [Anaerolineales bacterium]|nr:FtsK/SpoIIIE domain-containing protein [Anaerolineales bacterium]